MKEQSELFVIYKCHGCGRFHLVVTDWSDLPSANADSGEPVSSYQADQNDGECSFDEAS